jgi:hypothetical protein
MKYGILENNKFLFIDGDREKLLNTLAFIGKSENDIQEFEDEEVEIAYDNCYYIKGYAPVQPIEEYNEQVRQTRQQLFTEQADPLKFEYEECVARYGETDERTIKAKNIWLAKKDEIRENNPYRESVDIVD